MALTEKLTNIADAIREKTGGTEKLSLDGMAEAIAGISAGGGDEQSVLDSLIDRSITEIRSNATRIGDYAFYNYSNLTSVDFPLATKIRNYSFNGCSNLTSANFPLITQIGSSAFYNCKKLTSADFPLVTFIGDATFSGCSKLTSANFPLVPNSSNSAFNNCSKLTSANFPLITQIGAEYFRGCTNLTNTNFPLATEIGSNAFNGCSNLTSVDFPLVTEIGNYSFYNCYRIIAIVLRSEERICNLTSSNAFTNCYRFHGTINSTYNPEGLKDGYIYVPAALVESYKVATNWSTFATQFRALEDYTVDGTTTGALDESKI